MTTRSKHVLNQALTISILAAALTACTDTPKERDAVTLDPSRLHSHIETLASDEFQGRAAGSEGGERTVRYLTEQFQKLRLAPGNDGLYTQTVPLLSIELAGEPSLAITGDNTEGELAYGSEVMIWSPLQQETVRLEASELVFVGYGTVAPEYDWDDYGDLDLEGKTVVMLVNDPGFATEKEALFNGRAMTYYGRWTYKFEEAARQGATGALIIHEDEAAGYGWQVVSGSWSGQQLTLDSDKQQPSLAVEGWLSRDSAEQLLNTAGHSLTALKEAALAEDFRPIPLDLTASTELENRFSRSQSDNVIAHLPGRSRPEEYIIFTAHWDHLGVDPDDPSLIHNGAVDNATGTAAVLEMARVLSEMAPGPERSMVFLLTTAEEQGLLGSRYYAENPSFPLAQTVAGFNLDSMNAFGATRDITVVGHGNSELEDILAKTADELGRVLRPEDHPERGSFYRSDHFSLARMGVPVLYLKPGIDHHERGPDFGRAWQAEYQQQRYHHPLDEYDADWDLSGLAADTQLILETALRLSASDRWPNWYPGNEFRSIRDESRQAESNP